MKPGFHALRITVIYIVVAGLWILLSDHAVGLILKDNEKIIIVNMIKGWAFVGVTGLMLFLMVKAGMERVSASEAKNASIAEGINTIIRDMNDLVILVSAEGDIIDISNAALEVLKTSRESVTGKTAFGLIAEADRPRIQNMFNELLQGRAQNAAEFSFITSDGEIRAAQTRSAAIDMGGRTTVLVIARDLTELRKHELTLEKALDEARRSNKELEQFAYIVSHDLREPLRTMSNYISLIDSRLSAEKKTELGEFMHFVTDAASRMSELISGILQYSRIGTKAAVFARVDMKQALNEAVSRLELNLHETGAEVIAGDLLPVFGDRDQIVLLFQNLLENAVKFRKTGENPVIRVNSEKSGNENLFTVSDNGIGIDPEYHEKIFLIFQRLHSTDTYPGTGLGLAVCKKITERHGGKIWVKSSGGAGSTFLFSIPEKI